MRRIAESPLFDRFILTVILANAAVLGAETYDEVDRRYGDVLHTLNNVFLGIFVVEIVIRLGAVAFNPRRYFSSSWNVFDFMVVGSAFIPGLRENTTLLRLARLLRIVRAIRLLPDLRVLVTAVWRALPGVVSLAILTLLLLFVYGMVGWLIFDEHDPQHWGDIGNAMLTLFVMLTLENLPDNLEMGRQVSEWTILYFVSFALIAAFIIFNLFIGIVISSMEEARAMELQQAEEGEDPHAHAVRVEDRVRELRRVLDELERELRGSGSRA
jgi:voltage-gated sodium channel